jgi:putative transposase
MPFSARLVEPGIPLHITHRGVDRSPTFLVDLDFAYYRWALGEASTASRCAVHAYVLMTNHVHLLVTPADREGPSRMMQSIGRRYVRFFNDRYRRTGTLWEGRFRSTLVATPKYFFACSRYIELNPVRAGITDNPAAYEWSSFRHNAALGDDATITAQALYQGLGENREARCRAYGALFTTDLASDELATIRASLRARSGLAPTTYREAVDAMYERARMSEPVSDRAERSSSRNSLVLGRTSDEGGEHRHVHH